MAETATEAPVLQEVPNEEQLSEDDKKFMEQRARIAEAIKDDETFRLMLAEMYLFYSNMDKAMRSLAMNGGVKGIIKAMMGKGSE